MRLLLMLGLLVAAAASCGRGPETEHVVVHNEPVAVEPDRETLPPAVAATVTELTEIARSGSPWDMARLARATPEFRSNTGGLEHSEYWYLKYRTGDWPMEHLGKVLAYRPAVEDTPSGRLFIWPYMASVRPAEMTAKTRRDAEMLLGQEAAQYVATGAPWPGYRLGILEDGTWLYFYSGAE